MISTHSFPLISSSCSIYNSWAPALELATNWWTQARAFWDEHGEILRQRSRKGTWGVRAGVGDSSTLLSRKEQRMRENIFYQKAEKKVGEDLLPSNSFRQHPRLCSCWWEHCWERSGNTIKYSSHEHICFPNSVIANLGR